ncbi:hypothetical protein [Streptomyces erythrochromogenes]|uniref:hypothetical protein n=1 Tax=Streptomyces erythrochromogenes TaxID=285574 RepID=UPI00225A788B|nr:hypothetical protein [Streptomyces erythrochromogenes]MCX5587482.1 hypothetical protein [Streptomyces erythrochromogenes]
MTTRAVHPKHAPQSSTPAPAPVGARAGRHVLTAVALAATVPYLALKAAWLSGSRIGIPDGSVLLEAGPFLTVANAVTLAMDACVILLVLVLTRPWGLRTPAWMLTVPVFTATGLLTPILLGFPGQLLVRALGFGDGPEAAAAREPFLDSWVFIVVYTGFTVQGLALAALFVPYARRRWGRRWQGVVGERLPSPTGVVAAAAASGALVLGAMFLYWAFGGTAGLDAEQGEAHSAETAVGSLAHATCALAAGAGALLLARGGALRAWWPLGLAWVGAAATLAWGAWLLVASLGPQLGQGEGPSTAAQLIYAGQMVTGSLATVALTRFLISRRES